MTHEAIRKGELLRICIFIAVFSIVLSNNVLFACSCNAPQSPEKEFSDAEVIFTGKVIKKQESKSLAGEAVIDVTLEVLKSYKGSKESLITVSTAPHGKSCGISFEENKQYLVYANVFTGRLSANSCSRTKELDTALEDLKVLDDIATLITPK